MVHASLVAGIPLLVEGLELALPLEDVVPEGLALQLVLHHVPLRDGEDGGVEAPFSGRLVGGGPGLLLACGDAGAAG